MNAIQIYAIALGGLFCASILRYSMVRLWEQISPYVLKYFTYPHVLRRYRFLGPWSPLTVTIHLIYITVNIYCLIFRKSSILEIANRAGTLSLINSFLPFAGPSLSFLADLTGMSIATYKLIHRSTGLMSFSLALFHALTMVKIQTRDLFGLLVYIPFTSSTLSWLTNFKGVGSLCLLTILFNRFLRRLSYEIFLRLHQGLAAVFIYSMWRHISPTQLFSRICLYITIALCLSSLVLQCIIYVYRNITFRHGFPRATVTRRHGLVNINVTLSRYLRIRPGQYINLWIPSVSFWSFLQSHPFVVVSWTEGKAESLDLLVIPRKGLTQKMLGHADMDSEGTLSRLVMFSGPHGSALAAENYEVVVMVATGSGIFAQLPYLQQLVYGYNNRRSRTQQIRLIWCSPSDGKFDRILQDGKAYSAQKFTM